MKQSDIFSIIIIATVGTMASYFAVNAFLGNPSDSSATITTIDAISPDLVSPDSELFNPDAINPTVEVMIDGCKDLDSNGIIDYAELVACDKIQIEEPTELTFTCPDGSVVGDESQCPEEEEEEQPEDQQDQQQDNPEGQQEEQPTEGQ